LEEQWREDPTLLLTHHDKENEKSNSPVTSTGSKLETSLPVKNAITKNLQ